MAMRALAACGAVMARAGFRVLPAVTALASTLLLIGVTSGHVSAQDADSDAMVLSPQASQGFGVTRVLPPRPRLAQPPAAQPATKGDAVRRGTFAPPAPSLITPQISWQLENPFRFFTDPRDTRRHMDAFAALPADARTMPIARIERALGASLGRGWSEQLTGDVCWNRARNRHICPDGRRYLTPDRHRVAVELSGVPDAGMLRCVWRVIPSSDRGPARAPVTEACDRRAQLTIPYPSGARVTVAVGGRVIAQTEITVEDVLVVGMGDSFGSGEGNPDTPVRFDDNRTADYGPLTAQRVLTGYPARAGGWRQIADDDFMRQSAGWLDQACHRSLYSHQARVALQLAIENPKRAVTFVHVACSGADIVRGLFLRYRGHEWVPTPPDLSQISAIAEAQCDLRGTRAKELPEAYHIQGRVPDLQGHLVLRECDRRKARKIDLLLVSIGGNDIGFARLVANAVLDQASALKQLGGWFGRVYGAQEARQHLVELEARYKALNRALHYILHVPWSESDRVILTGYPAMALLDDGRSMCPSGGAGMDLLPVFQLNRKQAAAGQAVADELNVLMRKVAQRYGWTFVDGHRDAFLGHGICAGYEGMALSIADDLRFPRKMNGRWVPYSPVDYQPYAPRQRWFRTPNDAFLTGHFHVPGLLLQNVLRNQDLYWMQVLLAATYSGAFHPTAEGHAVMADYVLQSARRILDKYSSANKQAD